jgi:hypothetical protein
MSVEDYEARWPSCPHIEIGGFAKVWHGKTAGGPHQVIVEIRALDTDGAPSVGREILHVSPGDDVVRVATDAAIRLVSHEILESVTVGGAPAWDAHPAGGFATTTAQAVRACAKVAL